MHHAPVSGPREEKLSRICGQNAGVDTAPGSRTRRSHACVEVHLSTSGNAEKGMHASVANAEKGMHAPVANAEKGVHASVANAEKGVHAPVANAEKGVHAPVANAVPILVEHNHWHVASVEHKNAIVTVDCHRRGFVQEDPVRHLEVQGDGYVARWSSSLPITTHLRGVRAALMSLTQRGGNWRARRQVSPTCTPPINSLVIDWCAHVGTR
jgi:hypothetical protein